MPNYNYICTSCEHIQTEWRGMRERKNKTKCVKCGSKSTLTVSAPTILLDGSNPDFTAAHSRWVKEHESQGNGVRTE